MAMLFVSILSVKAAAQHDSVVSSYIEAYKCIALAIGDSNGIPPAIILAQGILESGCGTSVLTRKSNNHFGIKAGRGWSGQSVVHDDDKPNERFRSYASVYDSYQDHARFLRNGNRYAFLFLLDPCDYRAWAQGLKKAGYATNPRYAHKLIEIVERYKLNEIKKENEDVVINDW